MDFDAAMRWLRLVGLLLSSLLTGGCATYYTTLDRGVYAQPAHHGGIRASYIDPMAYPFWSLDHFYYSRFYHPHSVLVHRFDPWYYPYPGWYFGRRPYPHWADTRHRSRYFGNAFLPPAYSWYFHGRFGHWEERARETGRVQALNERLRQIETRQSQIARARRPDRGLIPAASPWLPASGRTGGPAVRAENGAASYTPDRRRPAAPRSRVEPLENRPERSLRLPEPRRSLRDAPRRRATQPRQRRAVRPPTSDRTAPRRQRDAGSRGSRPSTPRQRGAAGGRVSGSQADRRKKR